MMGRTDGQMQMIVQDLSELIAQLIVLYLTLLQSIKHKPLATFWQPICVLSCLSLFKHVPVIGRKIK